MLLDKKIQTAGCKIAVLKHFRREMHAIRLIADRN